MSDDYFFDELTTDESSASERASLALLQPRVTRKGQGAILERAKIEAAEKKKVTEARNIKSRAARDAKKLVGGLRPLQVAQAFDVFNKKVWIFLYLASAPVLITLVNHMGLDKDWGAIYNGYVFSTAFAFLYMGPLVSPFILGDFEHRLNIAHENWILYATCFTEVVIQIPHSLFVKKLHQYQGYWFEWAFFGYGLSDNRWKSYEQTLEGGGKVFSLPFQVNLINYNDGLLGWFVLAAWWNWNRKRTDYKRTLMLCLTTLFRDATLWRETVEYLWAHVRSNYQFTTTDPALRPHAIYLLWAINGLWLVAPLLTVVWAWNLLLRTRHNKDT